MQNNIFLPREIRVGYNKRTDTYSGKLAYVIYYDEKGKLRKETSWQSWRDKKMGDDTFKNEPMEGFVLNKKVGGDTWGWNPRQTYTRVYDPRGFEFEITVPNLLYILENCNAIKGKGLEGKFVYGWSGAELLLIPVDAPDYKDHVKFSEGLLNPEKKIGTKNLVPGFTYKFSNGEEHVYLGRFDEYHTSYDDKDLLIGSLKDKSHFFFSIFNIKKALDKTKRSDGKCWAIGSWKSIPRIAQCINDEPHELFPDMMDILEEDVRYKPKKAYKIETTPYEYDEFRLFLAQQDRSYFNFYRQNKSGSVSTVEVRGRQQYLERDTYYLGSYRNGSYMTSKEIFDEFNPVKVTRKLIDKGEKVNA